MLFSYGISRNIFTWLAYLYTFNMTYLLTLRETVYLVLQTVIKLSIYGMPRYSWNTAKVGIKYQSIYLWYVLKNLMSFKLRYFSTFFVVKYQRETSHARLSGRTHTLYRNIKTTKIPRCLAFIDRRKEYCSGQRLFHTYFIVRVLIIEDSTLTENCRTAIKALFFFL